MKRALILAGFIFFTFTPKFGMQKSVIFDNENDCVSAQGLVQASMFRGPITPGALNTSGRIFITQCFQGS